MKKQLIYLFAALLMVVSCKENVLPVIPQQPNNPDNPGVENPDNPGDEEPGPTIEDLQKAEFEKGAQKYGLDYVYDLSALPELHITVPLDQWNALLTAYDKDSNTKDQVHCDAVFKKGSETISITDAGIRLKGNTSRRRPEGNSGQMHQATNPQWRHVHFALNFRKYVKDDEHKVHGAKKVCLKFFNNDPAYCREIYSYNYFHEMGVWTASKASYCRLYLKVEGDKKEYYWGVYGMIEPVDDDFLKVRKGEHLFGDAGGNLWKCRFGATFADPNGTMGADLDDGKEYPYELKTNVKDFATAKLQLQDFIRNTTQLSGDSYVRWLDEHCDVDMLMKTYATNVALGMWDDYWNNCNNFYVYFNSTSTTDYTFYMLPYDYDNTLGTTHNCGVQSDAGKHDPFNWGDSNKNPLIYKMLQVPAWAELYRKYLLEAVNDREGKSWQAYSADLIRGWHSSISPYVANETGVDMAIYDQPASWGSRSYYRLLEDSENNYFKVKRNSILQYCK